jgi:hypothetical protein
MGLVTLHTNLAANMVSLGYKQLPNLRIVTESPSASDLDLRFDIKVIGIQGGQVLESGYIGAFLFELRTSYQNLTNTGRVTNSAKFFETLIPHFFKRDPYFVDFISLQADPTFLDDPGTGYLRTIGTVNFFYGNQGV